MNDFNHSCPLPLKGYSSIQLSHGGGGRLMGELLDKIILPKFENTVSSDKHDGAVFGIGNKRLAFTTDSYVISPIFFPGGDIGSLSIHGTVNDLAMCGATPLYLSVGFILEEGFPVEHLAKIVESMSVAAKNCNVELVTGDTKVVDKGKGDGIFINTAGIGIIDHQQTISPNRIKEGDLILLNGDIGRHGIAIMAKREGLSFETTIKSDSAELTTVVKRLFSSGITIHCMRDLTRGGLASSLVEISESSGFDIEIDENCILVKEEVKGACEILGFDPLYVANEGKFISFVPREDAQQTLEILGKDARIIGHVLDGTNRKVTLKSTVGTSRIIDMFSGEQLPRIC